MGWLWGLLGFAVGFVVTVILYRVTANKARADHTIYSLLHAHFAPLQLGSLRVAKRTFPMRMRADIQQGLDILIKNGLQLERLIGYHVPQYGPFGVELSGLINGAVDASQTPVEYEEVNIGEDKPARAQTNGLWFVRSSECAGAILLSRVFAYQGPGTIKIDIAAGNNPAGDRLIECIFQEIESTIRAALSYRGKILSLESSEDYTGEGTGLTVHKLSPVARGEVILPEETLALLDRNVIDFVKRRGRLGEFGQSKKKGLLLYGPPGVGKTHTIRYLATSLPGQTTILMTGEQMGGLAEYMSLARLLQPCIVVIEDVDLIARSRESHDNPCTEALLNKLLNEMDGLKDDAEIVFILTTNRPRDLEAALAARPGRIDQAIEFGYPDAEGRRRLVRLYAREAQLTDAVETQMVEASAGCGGAFIKELVRRSLQFHLEHADDHALTERDVAAAIDELLHRGGEINARALGVSLAEPSNGNGHSRLHHDAEQLR